MVRQKKDFGRCCLCNKDLKDPLLYSHRCHRPRKEYVIKEEDFEEPEPSWGSRLAYGFELLHMAYDDSE